MQTRRRQQAASVLEETLDEEESADAKLTEMAEGSLNAEAQMAEGSR